MKRLLILLCIIAVVTIPVIRLMSYHIGRFVAMGLLAVVVMVLIQVNRKK